MIKVNIYFILLILLTEFCVLSTAGSILEYAVSIPFIIFTAFLLILGFKSSKNFLYGAFKTQRNNRVLILFLLWTFFSLLINVFLFNAHIIDGILSLIFTYFLSFILVYYIGVILAKYFTPNIVIKLITISLFIIMIFGFIEYLMFVTNIPGLDSILATTSGNIGAIWYKQGLFPRIQSVFQEPSHYAWFLNCNIPFVFTISKLKYRLFKNKYINFFAKKTILPCFLISILMTQSAINLIFAAIIIIVYKLKTLPKKRAIFFILSLIVPITALLIFCFVVNISKTYLYRIIVTLQCLGNFSELTILEPSLATRLISYANMILIFSKNVIFGIGCGQIKYYFYSMLANSHLPLTAELAGNINNDAAGVNPAIFYKLLVDTGLIGILFIATFFYYLIKKIKFGIRHSCGILQDYFIAIKHVLYIYVPFMFYDSQLTCHYFWLLFGFASGFHFIATINKNKKENDNA